MTMGYIFLLCLFSSYISFGQIVFEKTLYKGDSVWVFPYEVSGNSSKLPPVLGKLPDGVFIAFVKDTDQKEISVKFNAANGVKNGLAEFYDTHGKIFSTGNYKDDYKNGKWESYFIRKKRWNYQIGINFLTSTEDNSSSEQKNAGWIYNPRYKKSFRSPSYGYNFSARVFDRSAKKQLSYFTIKGKEVCYYNRGQRDGLYHLYDLKAKQLMIEGYFKNDSLIGEWKHYEKNGELIKSYTIDASLRDVQNYKTFSKGQLKSELLYDKAHRITANHVFKKDYLLSVTHFNKSLKKQGLSYTLNTSTDIIDTLSVSIHKNNKLISERRYMDGTLIYDFSTSWINDTIYLERKWMKRGDISSEKKSSGYLSESEEIKYWLMPKASGYPTSVDDYFKLTSIKSNRYVKRKKITVKNDTLLKQEGTSPRYYSVSYVNNKIVGYNIDKNNVVKTLSNGVYSTRSETDVIYSDVVNGDSIVIQINLQNPEYYKMFLELYPSMFNTVYRRLPEITISGVPFTGEFVIKDKSAWLQTTDNSWCIDNLIDYMNVFRNSERKSRIDFLNFSNHQEGLSFKDGKAFGISNTTDSKTERNWIFDAREDREILDLLDLSTSNEGVKTDEMIQVQLKEGLISGSLLIKKEHRLRNFKQKERPFISEYTALEGTVGESGSLESKDWNGAVISKLNWTPSQWNYIDFGEQNDTIHYENNQISGVMYGKSYENLRDWCKPSPNWRKISGQNIAGIRVEVKNGMLNGRFVDNLSKFNEEATYKDNILVGEHKFYYDENKTQLQRKIDHALSDSASHFSKIGSYSGYNTFYYKNGTKSREGRILKGRRGVWYFYNEIGDTIQKINYDKRTIEQWYDSGKKKSNGIVAGIERNQSCNDEEDPIIVSIKYQNFWLENGDQTAKNGNGFINLYYPNKHLKALGKIENQSASGYWEYYNDAGGLCEVGSFVNGNKHGRWIEGDLEGIKYLENACYASDEDFKRAMEKQKNKINIQVSFYRHGKRLSFNYFNLKNNN